MKTEDRIEQVIKDIAYKGELPSGSVVYELGEADVSLIAREIVKQLNMPNIISESDRYKTLGTIEVDRENKTQTFAPTDSAVESRFICGKEIKGEGK